MAAFHLPVTQKAQAWPVAVSLTIDLQDRPNYPLRTAASPWCAKAPPFQPTSGPAIRSLCRVLDPRDVTAYPNPASAGDVASISLPIANLRSDPQNM